MSEEEAVEMIRDLMAALEEAIEGYEYNVEYKGQYLRDKHGDDADIARLLGVLKQAKEAGY